MKNIAQAILVTSLFVFSGFQAKAQLADTIWSGNAKVTIPALVACDGDGNPLDYPKTITGLTFILPVEVWFWDTSKFLIVYRQGDMGADPMRGALQPLIGEWNIPAAARIDQLDGVEVIPYGSDLYEIQTGSYTKKGNKYTFTAELRDTEDRSGDDGSWIYPDASTVITGSFTVKNITMSATMTVAFNPNPQGPGNLKTVGKNPSATVTLTKTSRTPSSEGVDAFLDVPQ